MSATTGSVTGSLPSSRPENRVDVRGPRFVAWVTTAVLIVTLSWIGRPSCRTR